MCLYGFAPHVRFHPQVRHETEERRITTTDHHFGRDIGILIGIEFGITKELAVRIFDQHISIDAFHHMIIFIAPERDGDLGTVRLTDYHLLTNRWYRQRLLASANDIAFLIDGFRRRGEAVALAWHDTTISYAALADQVERDIAWLTRDEQAVGIGVPVVLLGDFSPRSVSLFLALAASGAISVPLTSTTFDSLGALLDNVAPQLI